MSLWRVRISLADDRESRALLDTVLAEQRVLAAPDADKTGDLIIDLPQDEGLGALLNRLHALSPSVFVSSVDESLPLGSS